MKFNVGFTPVSITLSSQAEVDFFYTLLANAPDTLVGDFGLAEEVDELTAVLEMEASDMCFPDGFEVEDFYPALDEPVEDFCQGCAGCNTSMYEHKAERIEQPMQREHPCKSGCEACKGCNASESNYEAESHSVDINKHEAQLLQELVARCSYIIGERKEEVDTLSLFKRIQQVTNK